MNKQKIVFLIGLIIALTPILGAYSLNHSFTSAYTYQYPELFYLSFYNVTFMGLAVAASSFFWRNKDSTPKEPEKPKEKTVENHFHEEARPKRETEALQRKLGEAWQLTRGRYENAIRTGSETDFLEELLTILGDDSPKTVAELHYMRGYRDALQQTQTNPQQTQRRKDLDPSLVPSVTTPLLQPALNNSKTVLVESNMKCPECGGKHVYENLGEQKMCLSCGWLEEKGRN